MSEIETRVPGLSGTMEILPLDQIHPYENNPRTITAQAVQAVADSITRYGYRQPIVVDREHVVIVGHTRLAALATLGYAKAQVLVTDLEPAKADEYRLVDNRTGELATWDGEALAMELREFDTELLEQYFPDADLEIASIEESRVDEEDVEHAEEGLESVAHTRSEPMVEVECPKCHAPFEVAAKTLPGVTPVVLDGMRA